MTSVSQPPPSPSCCPRPARPARSRCRLALSFHSLDLTPSTPRRHHPVQDLHSAPWPPPLWSGGWASPAGPPAGPAPPVSARRIPRACGTEPPHAGVLACPSGAHSPSAFALRPRGLAPVRAAVTSLLYEDFVLRSSSRLGPEVFPGPCCHPVLSFPSAPCAVTAAFPPVPVVSSLPPDPVLSSTALGYPALIDSPSHHGPRKLMS